MTPRRIALEARPSMRKISTHGLPYGVTPHGNGFKAQASYRSKKHHLGTFNTPEEAHAAVLRFRVDHPKAEGPRTTLAERFQSYIRPAEVGDCILFVGQLHPKGYGLIHVHGRRRMMFAHRAAWLLAGNAIPPDQPHVLHSCDNPACVNVLHLRTGTHAENMADMARRDRAAKSRRGLPYGANPAGDKFASRATVGGRRIYLGVFDTAEEASAVALAAKRAHYGLPDPITPDPEVN